MKQKSKSDLKKITLQVQHCKSTRETLQNMPQKAIYLISDDEYYLSAYYRIPEIDWLIVRAWNKILNAHLWTVYGKK